MALMRTGSPGSTVMTKRGFFSSRSQRTSICGAKNPSVANKFRASSGVVIAK